MRSLQERNHACGSGFRFWGFGFRIGVAEAVGGLCSVSKRLHEVHSKEFKV